MTLFVLWMAGFPVLGFVAGVLGAGRRRVRQVLVWLGAVYAVAVFAYGLFGGGPHGSAYFADLATSGKVVVAAVTLLAFAPIVAAVTRSRVASLTALFLQGLLILIFTLGLAPWVPAASCVLAAAVAGPPDVGAKKEGPPA
jgi:hypothetical protein